MYICTEPTTERELIPTHLPYYFARCLSLLYYFLYFLSFVSYLFEVVMAGTTLAGVVDRAAAILIGLSKVIDGRART